MRFQFAHFRVPSFRGQLIALSPAAIRASYFFCLERGVDRPSPSSAPLLLVPVLLSFFLTTRVSLQKHKIGSDKIPVWF